MMANARARPLIWVLKGARAGDSAQALALALAVGGRVESKQLSFNLSHALPNMLAGVRISHLSAQARGLLHPPWPDLVVATGKRTAPVALWIKKQSAGKTIAVQIGRPRMPLAAFDLVISTPQYGLPARPNVVELPLPLAAARTADPSTLRSFQEQWRHLPRPHVLAVIGGAKFPLRLKAKDLANYAKLLNGLAGQGSVIVVDSPRSSRQAVADLGRHLTVPVWVPERGSGVNPYQAALALCDYLVVTSDSVSMVSEMLSTGKPTWIFRLPVSALRPRWSAKAGLGAVLANAGLLHPPRDVDGLMQGLLDSGLVGDLATHTAPRADVSCAHVSADIVARIRTLLASPSPQDGQA